MCNVCCSAGNGIKEWQEDLLCSYTPVGTRAKALAHLPPDSLWRQALLKSDQRLVEHLRDESASCSGDESRMCSTTDARPMKLGAAEKSLQSGKLPGECQTPQNLPHTNGSSENHRAVAHSSVAPPDTPRKPAVVGDLQCISTRAAAHLTSYASILSSHAAEPFDVDAAEGVLRAAARLETLAGHFSAVASNHRQAAEKRLGFARRERAALAHLATVSRQARADVDVAVAQVRNAVVSEDAIVVDKAVQARRTVFTKATQDLQAALDRCSLAGLGDAGVLGVSVTNQVAAQRLLDQLLRDMGTDNVVRKLWKVRLLRA